MLSTKQVENEEVMKNLSISTQFLLVFHCVSVLQKLPQKTGKIERKGNIGLERVTLSNWSCLLPLLRALDFPQIMIVIKIYGRITSSHPRLLLKLT